jgi:hypothetical protein
MSRKTIFDLFSHRYKICYYNWFLSEELIVIEELTTSYSVSCLDIYLKIYMMGRRGRDRIVIGFTTTYMQSVPITTYVVGSTPA